MIIKASTYYGLKTELALAVQTEREQTYTIRELQKTNSALEERIRYLEKKLYCDKCDDEPIVLYNGNEKYVTLYCKKEDLNDETI